MISYRFVPISSQKGVLFLRHPVDRAELQRGTKIMMPFFEMPLRVN